MGVMRMTRETVRLWFSDGAIPPAVNALARDVLARYDMNVEEMRLVAAKPHKGGAVWRLSTDRGPRGLKLLHRKPWRSWFSIGAQKYLREQGARVPVLLPTKAGRDGVETGGKIWIVTEWIDSLRKAPKDLEGAKSLANGLGDFHRRSRGYRPPNGTKNVSRLARWPEKYQKILMKLDWLRAIARTYAELPASRAMLSMIDKYEQQALEALRLLHESPYAALVRRGDAAWGIAHQDYGWSNGQIGPGGIWIIDLDGVAFDIPIRDLSKFVTHAMSDWGTWDAGWIREIIAAYGEAYPLEPAVLQVFYADLLFPNEFYKLSKKIVYDPPAA
ncbi:spore coat kinase CotI [Bacillaceae bacterium]